ncbi:DUF2848 domain-containing protein [Allopusillimonas ginsengisoli]|nr:DUF2848 domain-containing protein [Allopusillimonas ginsengisoli]
MQTWTSCLQCIRRMGKRSPCFRIQASDCFSLCFMPPAHSGMSCGTVSAIGGIGPSRVFSMELVDPKRQRSLQHSYTLRVLPEIA